MKRITFLFFLFIFFSFKAEAEVKQPDKNLSGCNYDINEKNLKEINKFFPTFQSELMKIAKTGVVKKENLSRKISRISRRIKKINK